MNIAVIGGGAAGMMCTAFAAQEGAAVTLFEKNDVLGRKLLITGKGRCNLTNNCTAREFIENVPGGGRFLYSAINAFSSSDTMDFFERLGVPLKTERGRRVFPVSDKSCDIRNALGDYIRSFPYVSIIKGEVKSIKKEKHGFSVGFNGKNTHFDRVVIATGGMSYPLTGSTGDGYRFARDFGHSVVAPKASLVPLTSPDMVCAELMGLSLKNVSVKFYRDDEKKTVVEDFGEMMFTHFGVTGPLILSASAHLRDITEGKLYRLCIDLKPALDTAALDRRILSDFEKFKNKDFDNSLSELLPKSIIPVIVRNSGISPHKKVNEITRAERAALTDAIKNFSITVNGTRPIEEAIVTKGGVSLKEIDPKTMQSKLAEGLYFAGEVIDCDAYTGGYNLQIAFSTAYLAAVNAAK